MSSGWGVDATIANGVVTSGTSSSDVRKIWGALYTPGIISGARVTTNADMRYTVSSGVVAIQTATNEVVMAPVEATTVPTPSANGTRVDIVWARQRFPGINGDSDSNVVIEVGTTLPARAVVLAKFTVNAGITGTNGAIKQANIDYSIPYGASLGVLHKYQHAYNGTLPTARTVSGVGSIHLPTDRNIRFRYTGVHCAANSIMWDTSKYCELGVLPMLDGMEFEQWNTSGLHAAWETVYFETTVPVQAGTHTVGMMRYRKQGPGTPYQLYGYQTDGYMRRGADFVVEDAGPIV